MEQETERKSETGVSGLKKTEKKTENRKWDKQGG